MDTLSGKEYRKEFISHFPGDNSGDDTPRQTPGMLWSKAIPTPVRSPKLLSWSDELAQQLGIEKPDNQDEINILGGSRVTSSMHPYAACYAGHQFGNWAGQLGDGRAITLGEWATPSGESWELQLKGAGMTPYSRRADGRAVLRSSVREYLMSEAMHYLGIPTTRALSLVSTGDKVMRDMFYDGNPEYEPGAIVMRAAPSFLRFGNFEMPSARKELDNLKQLVDWTINRYYPHIKGEDQIIRFFSEVMERTAEMIVGWMQVGFVHGVMNTDNMSILGLTIDYGPYSFLDDYDRAFTPNTTDLPGRRYAFGQQPPIAQWNLGCLAGGLAPLLPDTKGLTAVLDQYSNVYWAKYYAMMGGKLGLDQVNTEDFDFINRFEKMLATVMPDMTIFFQLLADIPLEAEGQNLVNHIKESLYSELTDTHATLLLDILTEYTARIRKNITSPKERAEIMAAHNPRFVLRNYLLHQAIEGLQNGDDAVFKQLQEAMKNPYSNKGDAFWGKRPDWAKQQPGCSMLSCSS